MTIEERKLPEMTLDELFASARAAGTAPDVVFVRINFRISGCDIELGTLTVTRNPASRRWLTTMGITQDKHYSARFAHGRTVNEALDRIEERCQEWLL
ncbi:MAG: hypothetical protein IT328_09390 [Caldilineaceae bacterium]|nr:hypothetical protein [Caldilineaceae bacterium]